MYKVQDTRESKNIRYSSTAYGQKRVHSPNADKESSQFLSTTQVVIETVVSHVLVLAITIYF